MEGWASGTCVVRMRVRVGPVVSRHRAPRPLQLAWAMRRRSGNLSTVPTLLLEERQHNPFMRVHVPSLKQAVAAACKDPRGSEMPEVPALAAMRKLKDAKSHLPKQEAATARAGGGSGAGAGSGVGGGASATTARSGEAAAAST